MRITCDDLGVKGCDLVAEGETPADVVEQVVEHLRSEHDIDMPDAEGILNKSILEPTHIPGAEPDKDVQLVVRRLREKLGIKPAMA